MGAWLRSTVRMYEGEGAKVCGFALFGALLQAGIALGIGAADSLLLSHAGVESLPVVYLLTPVMMLLYTPVASWLMSRYGVDRALLISLLVIVVGGISLPLILSLGLGPDAERAILLAFKLFAILWYLSLYSLYWNFTDQFFDIQDAKRLFSLFSAGMAAGAALGGAATTALSSVLPISSMFVVWAVLSGAAIPLLGYLIKRWSKLEEIVLEDARVGIGAQVRFVLGSFTASRYAMILGAVLFCTMNLTLLCEYQYYGILSAKRSEAELAAVIGQLFLWVNVGNIVVNLFLFNRLVAWMGVRNVALIQPVTYAIAFLLLLTTRSEAAALFGFIAYHGVLTSVDYNNSNFLLNALPNRTKRQLRAMIEGMCEPLANAVMGGILFAAMDHQSFEQASTAGIFLAAGTLALVCVLRTSYVSAMVKNLRESWLDLSRPVEAAVLDLSDEERSLLLESARRIDPLTTDVDEQVLAVTMLLSHDRTGGLELLLACLSAANVERPAEPLEELLTTLLESRDHEVIRRVLRWQSESQGSLRPRLVAILARFQLLSERAALTTFGVSGDLETPTGSHSVESTALDRAAAIAVARHNGSELGKIARSIETIDSMLDGGEEAKIAALHAIGNLRLQRYAYALDGYLYSPSQEIRIAALHALLMLVDHTSRRLIPTLLQVVERGDESTRSLAVECLARIGDSSALGDALEHAHAFGPSERRRMERIITDAGLRCVPMVVAALEETSLSYPARSIAARSLGRLSLAQLQEIAPGLIDAELRRAHEYRLRCRLLRSHTATSPGARVLSRFYEDRESGIVDFTIELLSLTGSVGSYELLTASLRSPNQKERANAIEAVQQACSRATYKLLGPLVESRRRGVSEDGDSDRDGSMRSSARTTLSISELVESALRSGIPLEAAAAAQFVWDECRRDSRSGVGREHDLNHLRKLLRENPATLRGEVLLHLLQREGANGESEHTAVERLDLVSSSPLFSGFPLEELQWITQRAVPFRFANGETIYDRSGLADCLFVIDSGEVVIEDGSDGVLNEPGAVFGTDSVFGAEIHGARARSCGVSGLMIGRDVVLARARASSQVARALMIHRGEAAHV